MLWKSPRPRGRRGCPPLTCAARAGVLWSALAACGAALAGPTGGQVVAGSGSIARPNVDTTVIQQQSQSLSIDWSGFDVASNELVKFQQPSSSSAVLNRVFNELPSQIHGRIQANGQVFIMNPNGVVFGSGARVEVGGLMASSLDIDVDDFMNGRYRFAASEDGRHGMVVNHGLITAATGGGVALLGAAVRNDGVIVADLGHVIMGAGRQALVDFDGDGLIRFQIDGAVLEDVSGADADADTHQGGALVNNGEILADGGQVLLSAAVARGVFDQAINNTGIIRANSIDRSPGAVRLSAAGGGIENSGSIDVSAPASGMAGSVSVHAETEILQRGDIRADAADGQGGRVVLQSAGLTVLDQGSAISARASAGRGGDVHVLGTSVAMLDAASIDVSGATGGGTVLLGGDYQGANAAIANARVTGVAAGAAINADATDAGDGGRVIVWSDDTTHYFGTISARGGPAGGDGGFAEVSGKRHLAYRGSADLSAAAGSRGVLLLDPKSIAITGGSGDSDGDGSDTQFSGVGLNSVVASILYSNSGPSVVYQSEIEAQSQTADITLQATRSISTSGTFDNGSLTLAPNSNLVIETRNAGSAETGLINLIASSHGPGLNIVTSGTGAISVRSGVGGDRSTPILLPNLISASDIHISAGGGSASSVLVFGTLSGANIAVDASGTVTVVGGARLIAGGDGTTLSLDASGITLLDGVPGAATVSNTGTGSVSLISSGAADIVLGEQAIASGVGLLSLSSGRSVLAINLTDLTDMSNEISSAGAVSLTAAEDIGSSTAFIEMGGVTDLMVDVQTGDIFISGSDGAGGAGQSLSSLSLRLHPHASSEYVFDNFAAQSFEFAQGGFGNNLVIREITSASALDLSIATSDHGIFIGAPGAAGIQLAGASNVILDAHTGIEEAVNDDAATIVAEVTTDGRLTLVANGDIGASSMLDIAAQSTGVAALQASSKSAAVRVRSVDALRIEGSGVEAANGGALAAGSGLSIAGNVVSGGDMAFSAGDNGAHAGDDLSIAAGALVTLDAATPAELRFSAGDNIRFDGGRVQTMGASTHRVSLTADTERGGSDGVVGRVSQSGVGVSVSAGQLSVAAGGGIGDAAALQTQAATLSVDNTTSGNVLVANEGDVTLLGQFRNSAQGGALTLHNDHGALNTGSANVASNAGALTLEARESDPAAPPGDRARITIGAAGLHSAGGDVFVKAADGVSVEGIINSVSGDATIQAGLQALEALVDGVGDLLISANIDTGGGELSLSAGAAIQQLAGRIAAARLRSDSGTATALDQTGNAVDRFAASAAGDVSFSNSRELTLGASDIAGDLHIDNAQSVLVADQVRVVGNAALTNRAGNIDGAGGVIEAGSLAVDSAAGIGVGAALATNVSGDIRLRSRGNGASGNIDIHQQGDLATRQMTLLATDSGSAQSVSIAASNVLTVDKDPVDTPSLQSGDVLELDATRIALAEKISANNVDVRFKAPVDVTGASVFIDLNQSLLTFDGNVSPGSNTTLTIRSPVEFASGHVTGNPDSSLVILDTLNLVTDTVIEVDNLRLSGNPASLTGPGSLTLLPATHGKDIVVGGSGGLVPDITLATLQGFGAGRALNIGVPAAPTNRSPFAGNVTVKSGLSVADAVLTVGGLGDVTLDNHADPLTSQRAINIVAVGDRRVFPGLVSHNGGDILDTDATAGARATLKAPQVNVIAQGRVGVASNALEVDVGAGGRANFVTGASNAFINTTPGGVRVSNVSGTSAVLAAFQSQGFFLDTLNRAALGRTVGLETTGLETTGLGELLYVDEGVYLLPQPYATPIQATLLPALMDPDFPADRRPDEADDEEGWRLFFAGALRDYVKSRYPQPVDADAATRASLDARVDAEWRALVGYFQNVRQRERAALLSGVPAAGSGG